MAKPNKVGTTLKGLYNSGVRKVKLFYTREVNGKRVPNYKTIALTAGVIAAAVGGYYLYKRHRKHGHVITQKAEVMHAPKE